MGGLSAGARSAAEAMVQQLGATEAALEMPLPPVAGDDDEELGLSSPMFQMRVMRPVVVVEAAESTTEVLVAARVLEELLGLQGSGAIATEVRTCTAVRVGDRRYRIRDVEAVIVAGEACLYRLLLNAAGTEAA